MYSFASSNENRQEQYVSRQRKTEIMKDAMNSNSCEQVLELSHTDDLAMFLSTRQRKSIPESSEVAEVPLSTSARHEKVKGFYEFDEEDDDDDDD